MPSAPRAGDAATPGPFIRRRSTPNPGWVVAGFLLAVFAAPAQATLVPAVPGPWQRTETREPCASFNVTRTPYFGDAHVHTTNSVDAILSSPLSPPRDAYRFAQGEPIGLPPYDAQGNPARTIQLDRPLDFAAVTDHSEGFGTQSVCFLPGLPGYDSLTCQQFRVLDPTLLTTLLLSLWITDPGTLPASVCGPPPWTDCYTRQSLLWLEDQDAAEEFYDRSAACTFTSFVGYEWTGTPGFVNLHRNVIFRNDVVPALPVSYIEQNKPQGLWAALKSQCQNSLPGCDWLAIPHNSNVSGPTGRMFLPENAGGSTLTAADAATRDAMEPRGEIYQHQGSSECRPGLDSTDEQCGFELVSRNTLSGLPTNTFGRLGFARNALKEGLVQEQRIGVNPFRLGIIASTDTHNASPGNVREDNYGGNHGVYDDIPARGQLGLTGLQFKVEHSAGGLAAVWAEENSRDAIFAAMRRRETFGTSGPRHLVRFFAGKYSMNMCGDLDFAKTGYRDGATMGAEIGPIASKKSPVFSVLAVMDPGYPSTPLQRIQIVKGWVDATGTAQEKVFDVAGDPNQGSVDTATCQPSGSGPDSLCATWKDPEFEPEQRAFYYARVLENPSCRWSTYVCNANGIDCSNPASVPSTFAACCDARVPKTIQERSWSSPIWYRPEGLGRVKASVAFGPTPGADRLKLRARLGRGITHDLASEDLHVIVRDDDAILDATIPAGTLQRGKATNVAGLASVRFAQKRSGPATLILQTAPANFASADRVDHMVDVEVRIGSFVVQQSRLWTFDGTTLRTR